MCVGVCERSLTGAGSLLLSEERTECQHGASATRYATVSTTDMEPDIPFDPPTY